MSIAHPTPAERANYLAAVERARWIGTEPPPKTLVSPPRPQDGMPGAHTVSNPDHAQWVDAHQQQLADRELIGAYEAAATPPAA